MEGVSRCWEPHGAVVAQGGSSQALAPECPWQNGSSGGTLQVAELFRKGCESLQHEAAVRNSTDPNPSLRCLLSLLPSSLLPEPAPASSLYSLVGLPPLFLLPAQAAPSPPSPPSSAFSFIPVLFLPVKVEEEAADKDNRNCSKDNMCSKVIGLKANSTSAL